MTSQGYQSIRKDTDNELVSIMQYQRTSSAAVAQKPSSHSSKQRRMGRRTAGVLEAIYCGILQLV